MDYGFSKRETLEKNKLHDDWSCIMRVVHRNDIEVGYACQVDGGLVLYANRIGEFEFSQMHSAAFDELTKDIAMRLHASIKNLNTKEQDK